MSTPLKALGLDIGGSGVKAAIVDLATGELRSDRVRLPTPRPATPEAVLATAAEIQRRLGYSGAVGCGFPGSIRRGEVTVAPNLDPSWVGVDLAAAVAEALASDLVAIGNDADAAGLAEVRFGAGRGVDGTLVVVTLGTGIGTAVFRDGLLVPGTELGHLVLDGQDAEQLASSRARKQGKLDWETWGGAVDRYLARLEYLLSVDRFVLGGGVSKHGEKFLPYLETVGCEVVLATMGNLAGNIGAALLVTESGRSPQGPERRSKG